MTKIDYEEVEQIFCYSTNDLKACNGKCIDIFEHVFGHHPRLTDEIITLREMGASIFNYKGEVSSDLFLYIQVMRGKDGINKDRMDELLKLSVTDDGCKVLHEETDKMRPSVPFFTYPDGSCAPGFPTNFATFDKPHKFDPGIVIDSKQFKVWTIVLSFPDAQYYENKVIEGDTVRLVVKYLHKRPIRKI